MEQLSYILPVIIFIILLWFTYINITFFTTKQSCKKQDPFLESCLSNTGTHFVRFIFLFYVIYYIVSIYFIIINLTTSNIDTASFYLNIITILSIAVSFITQQIIYTGRKLILIGRIPFDYRNIKRATFPTSKKLEFTCNQKVYHTSLHLVDKHKIKKAIQRSR